MNVQAVIDRARKLGYVSSGQYNDPIAIQDFNIVYKDIVGKIIQRVNEDFFWDKLQATTVDNQEEYVIDSRVFKVKEVYIKYNSTDDYYTPVREEFIDRLDKDLTWYKTNQAKDDPFYVIADESIFVYPAPETGEGGANLLQMTVTLNATDLIITDDEDSIILPTKYHYMISDGLLQYIYQTRGLLTESQNAKILHDNLVDDLIEELTDRNSVPDGVDTPDLSYYE